jgi:hypothetical protein
MPPGEQQQPKWTDDISREVLEALKKKAPQPGPCPICSNRNWQLEPGFIFLVLQNQVAAINLAGPGLPCIALACANCGNTQLINVVRLGLRHLIGEPTGVKQETGQRDG